jgi:hypothetical protein
MLYEFQEDEGVKITAPRGPRSGFAMDTPGVRANLLSSGQCVCCGFGIGHTFWALTQGHVGCTRAALAPV